MATRALESTRFINQVTQWVMWMKINEKTCGKRREKTIGKTSGKARQKEDLLT